MNEITGPPGPRPTTQAAEGLPRLRWTLDEFERLIELGIFSEDDRIELIGGELVPMHAKGGRHENVKTKLLNWLMRRLPDDLELAIELGWRPGGDIYLEPDIVIYRPGPSPASVSPTEVVLLIEVSDSSLAYDAGRKAALYAELGVNEYWVINAVTLATRVHREPAAGRYREMRDASAGEPLAPRSLPAMSLRLAELGVD